MATQTGFQVMIGDASLNPQMEATMEKAAEAFGGKGKKEESGKKKESSSSDKPFGLAPLVALALIAVIGALVFSFIAVFRDSARSERVTSVLSASALLLLLVQLLIGFPVERLLDEDMAERGG